MFHDVDKIIVITIDSNIVLVIVLTK